MPQLGATFVPGGYDDFYMPEVIAPAPQRVMPEVPQNMQEDLQRMEFQSQPRRDTAISPPNDPYAHVKDGTYQSYFKEQQERKKALGEAHKQFALQSMTLPADFRPFVAGNIPASMDAPSFSPFPKVKGDNIPPSDEEKEQILWQARLIVLHSNNVPMQVAWARDALMWVEVSAEAHGREWKRQNKGRDRERPATPKVEHELRVDAVNIIEYLAQQNHPEATFMRAKWKEFGKFGHRENKRDAYLGYKKAADLGWGRAEYRMGMLYEYSNDTEKAIEHYLQGAKLKDSAANYRLGMMYLMGQHGYPKDYQRGLEMIQIAADKADEDAPQGAYVYGMLIARELPDIAIPDFILPCELNIARQYIEKAAYLGFAKAQLKLGQAFELGQLGCDFNPGYSLHYYGLAAQQGQPEAALGVSRWFLFGYEGIFLKNEQLAFKYAEEAADAGLPTGMFGMGYYYEIGIHVQKDIHQARKWYELAAEHGNNDAKARLESLDQHKTLTKKDHETTTLTRIKSQYGSQRGKRPDRFAKPNDVMPSVAESPVDTPPPEPPVKDPPPPRVPLMRAPTIVEDTIDFPDPERPGTMDSRPPAFTVNIDSNLAMRPKSAAPYPEDDRPPPLTLSRPKSTAPYPDDDMKAPLSPHFNPTIRPSSTAGPHADRPMSAFGIRPLANSQTLQPNLEPRGRLPPAGSGWEPQVPAAYRQPSPGVAGRNEYPPRQSSPQGYDRPLPSQRLGAASVGPGIVPAGTSPVGDPLRNRLQKTNPNLNKSQPSGPAPGQYPGGGYDVHGEALPATTQPGQPGRDYGPRTSSRPTSDSYDRYGNAPATTSLVSGEGRLPSAGNGSVRLDRVDSLPVGGSGGGGGGGGGGGQSHGRKPSAGRPPLKDRPSQLDTAPGRASAPPSQGRPAPGKVTSPAPSSASTSNLPSQSAAKPQGAKPSKGSPTAHPDGKTVGQGPATFEEMGIPQGKNESDCIVM